MICTPHWYQDLTISSCGAVSEMNSKRCNLHIPCFSSHSPMYSLFQRHVKRSYARKVGRCFSMDY